MLAFDPGTLRITIRAALVMVPMAVLHASFVAEKPHYVQPDVSGHRGMDVEVSHDDMHSVAWRARAMATEAEQLRAEAAKISAEAAELRTAALLRAPR